MTPIYDFACKACSHEFEAQVAYTDKIPCQSCGAETLRKPAATRSYRIMGDNSASETPKRLAGVVKEKE